MFWPGSNVYSEWAYVANTDILRWTTWARFYEITTIQLRWHNNVHTPWLYTTGLHNIDGLVQDCSISIANALETLQSCT